nr:MAG TPA: hypothetical protein [Caudoviricetes sp.]
MGCIIIELKHKINPFMKKKNFFFRVVEFRLPKLESFKIFLQK